MLFIGEGLADLFGVLGTDLVWAAAVALLGPSRPGRGGGWGEGGGRRVTGLWSWLGVRAPEPLGEAEEAVGEEEGAAAGGCTRCEQRVGG